MRKLLTDTNKVLRITAVTGFGGAGLVLLGMLISGLAFRGRQGEAYALRNHFVSELGEVGISQLAWVFNFNLFTGGLLLTVFMLGLAVLIGGWFGWLFGAFALLTGVPGALVGIFPMDNLGPHVTVAMTFFNLGQLTMLVFSVYLLFSKQEYFARWLALPGFANAVFFFIFLNTPSSMDGAQDFEAATLALLNNRPDVMPLAIFEWVVILGVILWALLTSFHLWRYLEQEGVHVAGTAD